MCALPIEMCALINNRRSYFRNHPLCVCMCACVCVSPPSVIYSSCEMSHFAALSYPQDISNLFLSSENSWK